MREDGIRRDATYKKVIASLDNNTKAITKADNYLRERNGRDAQAHRENIKAIATIPIKMQAIADKQAATLIENLKKLPAQKIQHQLVKDQTVEHAN